MRSTRRFLGALAALVLGASALSQVADARADPPAKAARPEVREERCPVMGDIVKNPARAPKSEYKGRTYYFCCPACKPEFDADPEKYAGKAAPEKPVHRH